MKRLLGILGSILLLAAGTFVGIRMATAPTTLTLTTTYEFPDFVNLATIAPDRNDLKQAVAIDGIVAYTNSDTPQATASTAKMLTALMVMEKQPFALGESGATITITPEFYQSYIWYLNHNGTTAAVTVDEQLSEYDALAGVLLPSGNNLADSLAIWAFGSLEAYQAAATAQLTEWGLVNTIVGTDASGYSETTTSTAADLAVIGYHLMQNPVLAEIVGLESHTIPVAGPLTNTNQLLGTAGIVGVKTGYIGDPSGYCLVSAYRLGEHIVTVSVLGATTRAESFASSEALVTAIQSSLAESTIVTASEVIGHYDSWWAGTTPIIAGSDLLALGWQSVNQSAQLTMDSSNITTADTSNVEASNDTTSDPATGNLTINLGSQSYQVPVSAPGLQAAPTLWQRFLYAIGRF